LPEEIPHMGPTEVSSFRVGVNSFSFLDVDVDAYICAEDAEILRKRHA